MVASCMLAAMQISHLFPARVARQKTLAAASLLFLLGACGAGSQQNGDADSAGGVPDTLRVGIIPNIAPEEQQAKYEPLGDYLGAELDTEVELFVAADYAGVVAALAADRIDIAYLGGLTYVQAEQQVDLTPLVTEIDALTKTTEYDSAIVVAQDSKWQSVTELIDNKASFAFGDPSSTSGSLYPRILLTEAGAECDKVELEKCPPLESTTFTGGHDATAEAVASGAVDAGGLELRVLKRLESEGVVEEGALRVIETVRVPGYPWVGRTALGEDALTDVTQAFLDISDPELLDLLRAVDYAEIEPADYDEVRTQGNALGLVTTQ
jgi:phosphonate transport system substrate-binding protein